jgi:hypothetical protein
VSPCRVTSLSPGLVILMGTTCGQQGATCGNRVDKLSSYTGRGILSPGYPHPLCTKICLASWAKNGFPQYPQDLLLLLQIVRARLSEIVCCANSCGQTESLFGQPLSGRRVDPPPNPPQRRNPALGKRIREGVIHKPVHCGPVAHTPVIPRSARLSLAKWRLLSVPGGMMVEHSQSRRRQNSEVPGGT